MEKQKYLKYFCNKGKQKQSSAIDIDCSLFHQQRSLHLNGGQIYRKILPHIKEEYEYKITNKLIVHKIMNPKRDKKIIQSLPKSTTRPVKRKIKHQIYTLQTNQQFHHIDTQNKQNQKQHKGSISSPKVKEMQDSSIINYFLQQSLQNQRISKSVVQKELSVEKLQKTFITQKLNKKNNQFAKENHQTKLKGAFIIQQNQHKIKFQSKNQQKSKVFFNALQDQSKPISDNINYSNQKESQRITQNIVKEYQRLNMSNSRCQLRKTKTTQNLNNQLLKNFDLQIKSSRKLKTYHRSLLQIYGSGPTILMIYNLEIKCHPPLHKATMLIFQLLTNKNKTTKLNPIITSPIQYQSINYPIHVKSSNGIRFAINVSQTGDFVPLRIYKLNGVQLQQLGIIDVDLSSFRYRRQIINEQSKDFIFKEYRYSKNGEKIQRDIVSSHLVGNLRKNLLKKSVQTVVACNYKIYPKKYQQNDIIE